MALLTYAWVAYAEVSNTGVDHLPTYEDYQSDIIAAGALQNQLWLEGPVVLGKPAKVAQQTLPRTYKARSDAQYQFIWPTNVYGITQFFSTRHTGIDISDGQKEELYAAAQGTVSFVGWSGGYGNTVIITHSDGYQTLYAHLSGFTVEKNQEVTQGQVIGFQGNTGYVVGRTGIHCHFMVLLNGVPVNPLNFYQ